MFFYIWFLLFTSYPVSFIMFIIFQQDIKNRKIFSYMLDGLLSSKFTQQWIVSQGVQWADAHDNFTILQQEENGNPEETCTSQ